MLIPTYDQIDKMAITAILIIIGLGMVGLALAGWYGEL